MNIIEIYLIIKHLRDEIRRGVDVELNREYIISIINGIKNRKK